MAVAIEDFIAAIRETEAAFAELTPLEVLQVVQTETCASFMNGSLLKQIGTIGPMDPQRTLPWTHIHTEKKGWIGLRHFLTGARMTAQARAKVPKIVLSAGGIGYEAYLGFIGRSKPGMCSSAWSPEDITSNNL